MTTETLQDTRPYRSLAREELEARGRGLEADLAELEAGYTAQAEGYSAAALRRALEGVRDLPKSDAKKPEVAARWVRHKLESSVEHAELRRLREEVGTEEHVLRFLDTAVKGAEEATATLVEATASGWHGADQWLRTYGDGLMADAARARLVKDFRLTLKGNLETDLRVHTLSRVKRLLPVAMGSRFNNARLGAHGYSEYAEAQAARWFIATVQVLLPAAEQELLDRVY